MQTLFSPRTRIQKAALISAIFALSAHWIFVRAAEVTIFAAASLADALQEVGTAYHTTSGDTLRYNFAASNALARQIKEGAPADLFLSADEEKMNDLARGDFIVEGSRQRLLSNTLVIVVRADDRSTLRDAEGLLAPDVRRIALGETQTVPAGIYARKYLETVGLWDQLKNKVVPTESVRAALSAVESGNVSAGIVYRTDALISTKVRVAFEVPADVGPRITYPVAIIKKSRQPEAAHAFARYLQSAEAKAIFQKFGFGMAAP